MTTRPADAVIAGAGIAGIACAWQLAERSAHATIVIVDPEPPLSVTSARPEASYRDWWPQPEMTALVDRSIRLMEELRSGGEDVAMDRRGYLYVTADDDRAEAFRAAGAGSDRAELLDSVDLRRAYPHLSTDLVGGLRVHRAGGIDTVALGHALLRRATARGARVLVGRVVGLEHSHGRLGGVRVRSADGVSTIPARRFVNAAGPFAGALATELGETLPIQTVLRQKVVIADDAEVVPVDAPFTIGVDPAAPQRGAPPAGGIHVKPVVAGGSRGLKLGWAYDQEPRPPTLAPSLPEWFPEAVIRGAATFIPGLDGYVSRMPPLLAHEGGFYARTPDGRPLIGHGAVAGSFLMTAFAGFGAMIACGAAELLVDVMLDEARQPAAGPFTVTRFDGGPGDGGDRTIATGEL
jgi:glycine/D-amino acid oxidase-like deaminating enzyme